MKTILRIIVILLVASIVAGGFFIALDNTSTLEEGGQPPALTAADGQSLQPTERPEGGDLEGGSMVQGLTGLLTTAAKLAGITLLVLMLERGLRLLSNRKPRFVHQ